METYKSNTAGLKERVAAAVGWTPAALATYIKTCKQNGRTNADIDRTIMFIARLRGKKLMLVSPHGKN
jgi:hypothetical protein